MKNIDYIKSLDVEKMARFFARRFECDECTINGCYDTNLPCHEVIKQWLNEERDEN